MPGVRPPAEFPTFFDRVIEEVRALPGVTSASAVTQLPMSGAMLGSSFRADDRPDAAPVDADLRGITTDYFQTMGIALIAGRAFDAGDDERGRRVAIVDEGLARRLSLDGQAVGRRIRWIRQPDVPIEIVGVVRAVRHRGLDQEPVETVYRPHAQYPRGSMYLTVRVAGEPTAWSGSVAAAVHRVDPSQLVADVAPLSALERRSIAQPGLGALVGGLLGTLALVMTAVGVYGLFAFAVAQRRREMAIRLAVGATPGGIVRLIARDGARIVGLGLAMGLPVAFVAAQLLGSLMPAVAATGQGPFLYGAGLVIVVAAIACGVPARRASRIEPNAVLRAE
jgi:putative ABC transport system permease protein